MARRPSTYDERREDLARLFYDTTRDEMDLRTPHANDIAARAVLADALEERGMHDLAERLRRFPPRGRFMSSLLREKVRRAIFGPERRVPYAPRKPVTEILLAYVIPRPQNGEWYRVSHVLYEGDGPGTYFFHTISDGRYLVRGAWSIEDALDAARERWPNVFGEDVDDGAPGGDYTVDRVARVRRARVVGHEDLRRAFVPDAGVVEYQ